MKPGYLLGTLRRNQRDFSVQWLVKCLQLIVRLKLSSWTRTARPSYGYVVFDGFSQNLNLLRFEDHLHGLILECMFNVLKNFRTILQMVNPYSTHLLKYSRYGILGGGVMTSSFGLYLCPSMYDICPLKCSKNQRRILSTASEPQPEPESTIFTQFAKVDMGILSWHFGLSDRWGHELAYISRAFRGFGREVSQYLVDYGLNLTTFEDFHRYRSVNMTLANHVSDMFRTILCYIWSWPQGVRGRQ